MVGGSGEISPLPPTIFVMITNQKWQLYHKDALPQQRYLLKIQSLARAPAAAEGFSQRYAAKAAYREDIPL